MGRCVSDNKPLSKQILVYCRIGPRSKFQWNLNQKPNFFFRHIRCSLENVTLKMSFLQDSMCNRISWFELSQMRITKSQFTEINPRKTQWLWFYVYTPLLITINIGRKHTDDIWFVITALSYANKLYGRQFDKATWYITPVIIICFDVIFIVHFISGIIIMCVIIFIIIVMIIASFVASEWNILMIYMYCKWCNTNNCMFHFWLLVVAYRVYIVYTVTTDV